MACQRPPSIADDLREMLDSRLRIFLSIAIDTLMGVLIVLALWIAQRVGERWALHGIALWFWYGLECLLGASSLLVVLLYLIRDLRRLYRRLIREEGPHE